MVPGRYHEASEVAALVNGAVHSSYFGGKIVLIRFAPALRNVQEVIQILSEDPRVQYAEPNYIVSIAPIKGVCVEGVDK